MFGCPARFEAGVLQWHFDAAVLQAPCPEANPITAGLCAQFCERLLDSLPHETALARSVRDACLGSRGSFPSARDVAARLGLSVRTLHPRLTEEGQHYQGIVDQVRSALAIELLGNTTLSVEEVASRVGFAESSNFRKAFRRWTGQSPVRFRAPEGQPRAAAAPARALELSGHPSVCPGRADLHFPSSAALPLGRAAPIAWRASFASPDAGAPARLLGDQ